MIDYRPSRRIQLAMERGFLNARCVRGPELLQVYGFWCWRMALPMVWIERYSPHSRYSRVRLDLFTTPFRLTVAGRAALIAISAQTVPARYASISEHQAEWDRVPNRQAEDFAKSIFRAARRHHNYELQPAAAPMKPRLAATA